MENWMYKQPTKEQIKKANEIAEAMGFKAAPPDHPVYSEPAQIIFLNPGKPVRLLKRKINDTTKAE